MKLQKKIQYYGIILPEEYLEIFRPLFVGMIIVDRTQTFKNLSIFDKITVNIN